MHYICNNGFEHHVVMNLSNTADILEEAYSNYLGWSVYHHKNESYKTGGDTMKKTIPIPNS